MNLVNSVKVQYGTIQKMSILQSAPQIFNISVHESMFTIILILCLKSEQLMSQNPLLEAT